jgi:hypothetical protein
MRKESCTETETGRVCNGNCTVCNCNWKYPFPVYVRTVGILESSEMRVAGIAMAVATAVNLKRGRRQALFPHCTS